MSQRCRAALVAAALAPALAGQQGDRADEDRADPPPGIVVPPAVVLSPEQAQQAFVLQPGCRIELVAAEPLLADPVAAVFDARGRLWVVEMRSYMRDVDGHSETTPDGRVVVLADDDGDGRMDRVTTFADGLVLPRAVLPLAGGALVIAPPHLVWYLDRDGDLVPEQRQQLADGFESGLANPEHSGNGLLWALDNGIHLANDRRLWRWTPDGFRCETGAGGGQWGITQDDRGRLYFNYNEDWLRCDLVPGRYAADATSAFAGTNHRLAPDPSVWPARVTVGVNRGGRQGMLDSRGYLTRHTAVCAPFCYRGEALPAYGDVFVCEPAAHLVRRFRLADQDGRMTAGNVYEHAEFLASTDERFRPVNLCSGPDGALYVVDMYRGLIQHRNFVTTFLRKQVLARGLEQPTGRGRIWRVVADDHPPPPAHPLAPATTRELVAALVDRDGWRRETAQRLLVQRQDAAALPLLKAQLRACLWPPGKSSTLAALAGLQAVSHDDLRHLLHEPDPGLLAHALGLAAPFLRRGDAVLWSQCEQLAVHAAASVRWHLALALGEVGGARAGRALELAAGLAAQPDDDPVLRDCLVRAAAGAEPALARALLARAPAQGLDPLLRALGRATGTSRDGPRQEELLQVAAGAPRLQDQRALLQGLLDALPREVERRRGFFVFAATPPALAAMARIGDAGLTALVGTVLAATELRPAAVPAPPLPADAGLSPAERERVHAGARVYGAYCGACHQQDGRGLAGLAPPLRDSEWVTGPAERLIRVALHGVRGPLTAAGVEFDGEMPGQAHLGDDDLAAALSWLRRAFEHRGAPIAPADVAAVRAAHAGRTSPWRADELAR